jgi:CPA1 family monovalent cation:H+ antiporter
MSIFVIIALLVILTAIYAYVNARWFKLPATIGIITLATVVSVVILILDKTNSSLATYLVLLAGHIDFSRTVLNIMLGFLLFAGSFNIDNKKLIKESKPILVLSTLSVLLSTLIFGLIFFFILGAMRIHIPLIYCLLFGAVISPTDPVAVASILKKSKLPPHLETIMTGESLFNDAFGLVIVTIILEITGNEHLVWQNILILIIRDVLGGIAAGLVLGFVTNRLMRSIRDFQAIVLLSLALVMGLSLLSSWLHLSVPLATVSAGIFADNRSINLDYKERSHEELSKFWQLADELLNAILFVMIGLQMVNVPFIDNYWLTSAIAIGVILIARWLSIITPWVFIRRAVAINLSNVNLLTWAGVRGGISIALALSLPRTIPYRHIILSGSYFIVIFSIIFQGLTLNRLISFIYRKEEQLKE